jgi:hypothetical protein
MQAVTTLVTDKPPVRHCERRRSWRVAIHTRVRIPTQLWIQGAHPLNLVHDLRIFDWIASLRSQ